MRGLELAISDKPAVGVEKDTGSLFIKVYFCKREDKSFISLEPFPGFSSIYNLMRKEH